MLLTLPYVGDYPIQFLGLYMNILLQFRYVSDCLLVVKLFFFMKDMMMISNFIRFIRCFRKFVYEN